VVKGTGEAGPFSFEWHRLVRSSAGSAFAWANRCSSSLMAATRWSSGSCSVHQSPRMSAPARAYFLPHSLQVSERERGCLSYDQFRGQWSGGHVVCEQFDRDSVIGTAHLGGAYWMRAIGADD
jgi:hypothetical protein